MCLRPIWGHGAGNRRQVPVGNFANNFRESTSEARLLAAGLCLALMGMCVKLSAAHFDTAEMVFWRSVLGMTITALLLARAAVFHTLGQLAMTSAHGKGPASVTAALPCFRDVLHRSDMWDVFAAKYASTRWDYPGVERPLERLD